MIAHVGAPDARHASRLARAAVALGARRIAAITPYYLPARPDELVTHYRRIREAAPGPELYAYIFPERTGLHVPPSVFAQVAEAAGLAGAKVSGSASAEVAGYVAAAPGVAIFSGNDANPAAAMRAGAAGVISGRSSAYPEVYAALRDETLRHQPEGQARLDRIVALGASIGRVKHALAERGLATTAARMTVDPPDPDTAAAIAAEVAALSVSSRAARPGRRSSLAAFRPGRRSALAGVSRPGRRGCGPALHGTSAGGSVGDRAGSRDRGGWMGTKPLYRAEGHVH